MCHFIYFNKTFFLMVRIFLYLQENVQKYVVRMLLKPRASSCANAKVFTMEIQQFSVLVCIILFTSIYT